MNIEFYFEVLERYIQFLEAEKSLSDGLSKFEEDSPGIFKDCIVYAQKISRMVEVRQGEFIHEEDKP